MNTPAPLMLHQDNSGLRFPVDRTPGTPGSLAHAGTRYWSSSLPYSPCHTWHLTSQINHLFSDPGLRILFLGDPGLRQGSCDFLSQATASLTCPENELELL